MHLGIEPKETKTMDTRYLVSLTQALDGSPKVHFHPEAEPGVHSSDLSAERFSRPPLPANPCLFFSLP